MVEGILRVRFHQKLEWDLSNGPLSCDRAIGSGSFGVRSVGPVGPISWTDSLVCFEVYFVYVVFLGVEVSIIFSVYLQDIP